MFTYCFISKFINIYVLIKQKVKFLILLLLLFSAAPLLAATPTPSFDGRAFLSPELLLEMRSALSSGILSEKLKTLVMPTNVWGISLKIYQHGVKPITIVRNEMGAAPTLYALIESALKHNRISKFSFSNSSGYHLQIDFILNAPEPVEFKNLTVTKKSKNRFEVGIDGLQISDGENTRYFLPGDGFTESVLSKNHLKSRIKSIFPGKSPENLKMKRFQSESYLSGSTEWIRLYRGYPQTNTISIKKMKEIATNGVQWLIRFQKPDGSFTYYYDGYRDSYHPHQIPKNITSAEQQYNIVRHCTGVMALLDQYEYFKDPSLINPIINSMKYLSTKFILYKKNGKTYEHVVHNQTSKLGASGLALYCMVRFKALTGRDDYDQSLLNVKNHVLDQVLPSGEFRYFYQINGRRTSDELNAKQFNFYYPGEAILALVEYYLFVAKGSEKSEIASSLNSAIDFLLNVRPTTYAARFKGLSSDAWLMMAFASIVKHQILNRKDIISFVFNDAALMMSHQYDESTALYEDYAGAFYYHHGDQPYPDGSRSEGLLGALRIANHIQDKDMVQKTTESLLYSALAVSRLYNSPESLYFSKRPQNAIGGIRLKYTRHWLRIDTIHHVVSFYLKLMPILESSSSTALHSSKIYKNPT